MTLTFLNKELQKKGGSKVASVLDKEQQRVGGNLQVKAFLCTKSIGVKIVKKEEMMDVSGDPSFIHHFLDGKHDSTLL